jgi:hypothetical protein
LIHKFGPQGLSKFCRWLLGMNQHDHGHPISNLLLTGMILSVAAGGLISWFSWGDDISAAKAHNIAAASIKELSQGLAGASTTVAAEKNARVPSSINKALTRSISAPQSKGIDLLVKYDLNCAPLKMSSINPTQSQSSLTRGPQNFGRLVVRGGFVQLHGKACLKLKDKSSPIITNLTNGFQGAFFRSGQGHYKTDLIQLNEGENKIQVEFQNSAGKKSDLSFLVISHRI